MTTQEIKKEIKKVYKTLTNFKIAYKKNHAEVLFTMNGHMRENNLMNGFKESITLSQAYYAICN